MGKVKIECYDDLLKNLTIKDIALKECEFKRNDLELEEGPIQVQVKFTTEGADYLQEQDNIVIHQPFTFSMIPEPAEKDEKILEIKASYEINYKLEGKLTKELFKEYAKASLPKIVHPYVRELVTNLMSRAGMPSFILPIFENR